MSSNGKIQAVDNISENMPSAGIEPATSGTAVEGANHSTTSAIQLMRHTFVMFVINYLMLKFLNNTKIYMQLISQSDVTFEIMSSMV